MILANLPATRIFLKLRQRPEPGSCTHPARPAYLKPSGRITAGSCMMRAFTANWSSLHQRIVYPCLLHAVLPPPLLRCSPRYSMGQRSARFTYARKVLNGWQSGFAHEALLSTTLCRPFFVTWCEQPATMGFLLGCVWSASAGNQSYAMMWKFSSNFSRTIAD